MNLQQRLQGMGDLEAKCSEINRALRHFKENYELLIANLPSYSKDGDIAFMKQRITDLERKDMENKTALEKMEEKNKVVEEENKRLNKSISKYKSDIKKIARILTQQEEVIKKFEVILVKSSLVFRGIIVLVIYFRLDLQV